MIIQVKYKGPSYITWVPSSFAHVNQTRSEEMTMNTSTQKGLQVEARAISGLRPCPNNARTHSRKQVHQIASSIREFGFNNPVLLDGRDEIIAGHGRVEAAKLLGMDRVPCIRIEHLSEEQKRAYVIADNKLALNAGWDPEILAIELQHLSSLDLSFDVEITGFEMAEIDGLIDSARPEPRQDEADQVPVIGGHPVSRPGDLWILGDHKLLCADSREPRSYERLLERKARVCFADPPYNVKIDGHVCGLGAVRHREFAMASGEMTEPEFAGFLETAFRNMAAASLDGAIHFICMDWRHLAEVLAAGKPVYSGLKNLCVWNKTNGGMGSFYRSKHELVFVFKVGEAPHTNTVELGKNGRYRTNVWDYAGVNAFGQDRSEGLAVHPTVKPVALVCDAIKDCSRRGEIILDPFCGSGTTIIAAERCGRHARALEIDPLYADVAVRRWEAFTGHQAIHAETGRPFADLATEHAQ